MPAAVDLEKCDGCKGRKEKGMSMCVEGMSGGVYKSG